MPTFQNALLERLIGKTGWSATAAGLVLTAVGAYVWKQFAPCAPADWGTWAIGAISVAGPAVLGAAVKAK